MGDVPIDINIAPAKFKFQGARVWGGLSLWMRSVLRPEPAKIDVFPTCLVLGCLDRYLVPAPNQIAWWQVGIFQMSSYGIQPR